MIQSTPSHALPASARLSRRVKQRVAPITAPLITDDDEPPFDPPDDLEASADVEDIAPANDSEAIRVAETGPAFVERREVYTLPPESALPRPPKAAAHLSETPVPPITILATWDRPDIAAQLDYFKAHAHISRARVRITRGGLDAAIAHCSAQRSPDLLIIDTHLDAPELLDGVDRLKRVVHANTQIIIIGAINDVTLLRGLGSRGVADYIVPPARKDDLIRTVCRLFAESDPARVIAVMGARGGVGASTIAQNLAWSIASRHDAPVSLIDLNLAYGDDAFAYGEHCVAEPYAGGFERVSVKRLHRLSVIVAPSALRQTLPMTPDSLRDLIAAARRDSAVLILDLPHDWNAWVKAALLLADERVIVLTPDLAGLRNAEAILRQLKNAKAKLPSHVALSLTGAPGRPDIPERDIVEALGAQPVASFAFEPDLVGLAALEGRAIAETSPRAKLALQIDAIADAFTGFELQPLTKSDATTETVTHPYTFRAPGEAAPAWQRPSYYAAAAQSAKLLDAAQSKTKARRGRPAVRGSLRIAALLTLLVVSASWAIEVQHDHASAATFAPAASLQTLQPMPAQPAHREPVTTFDALERDAALGYCRAMHDLALHLATGEGAARDDSAAYRWFRQAAELGVADSQYNLGMLHQQGIGAPASLSEALFWFDVAALQGDAAATERAATLTRALPENVVANAEARAQAFRPRTSPLCPDAAPR